MNFTQRVSYATPRMARLWRSMVGSYSKQNRYFPHPCGSAALQLLAIELLLLWASCPPPYGPAQAVQITPSDLVRVVVRCAWMHERRRYGMCWSDPCPAPPQAHTSRCSTEDSRLNRRHRRGDTPLRAVGSSILLWGRLLLALEFKVNEIYE